MKIFQYLSVLFLVPVVLLAEPVLPGNYYAPPDRPTADGAPVIYEHSREAGPDETFFIVGRNLTGELSAWGASMDNAPGQALQPKLQFLKNGYLAATLPERAQDGPFLVWVKNNAGWSKPIVLNRPDPWWCGPDAARPGDTIRVFGRNLACRPDHAQAFVYIARENSNGIWARVVKAGKHAVSFIIPASLEPGNYDVSIHAGNGGENGWSRTVPIRILSEPPVPGIKILEVNATGKDIQNALSAGEGQNTVIKLPAGNFEFSGTLRIPAGVTLTGTGRDATFLRLVRDQTATFPRLGKKGWNETPGAVHTPGDIMEYSVNAPKSGTWTVWLRYATEMSQWNQPGVSGNMTLQAGEGAPVTLENLPNTGSFGTFKWAKCAELKLAAGSQSLTWKNIKGGGLSLDAFVFAQDTAFSPTDNPMPETGGNIIVLQGEDVTSFRSKDGHLPGGDRAAVWLAGNNACVSDLTILGTPQVNLGIAIRSPEESTWISGCRIERVRVADNEGKHMENCGLLARYAERAIVRDNEITGRAPLFLSGARRCEFIRNRLVSYTRFGGGAEAAILGRNETVEQCIIEGNVVASPAGAEAGGPTVRRLIWLSTGNGSITHNWLADNGVEPANGPGADRGASQARFGGVAGTDQNVGEMILFEGNHRTAYFGPVAAADNTSVTLPATVPPTPDNRLGNVKREQLAHDSEGNETPFWPPDKTGDMQEPPIGEYYVTVFAGAGQGQTRRVIERRGEKLILDKPWSVMPEKGSIVSVATAFYRNIIKDNYTCDGMTGIQLWISCIENIVSGNTIARQRKPGIFLYANGTTLASSMPRTWNRGISPLFWNTCEGNRIDECSAGALVTSGDTGNLPIEFPRALGNVLRHNSFIRSRSDGVAITSRGGSKEAGDTSPSIVGTIVEFNVVRDAVNAYHVGRSADGVVLRRNHAYFWYPVNNNNEAPVTILTDEEETTMAIEHNTIEGIHGGHDGRIIDFKSPAGEKRLPTK